MNPLLQIWLTWIFSKAIGLCGAGLAAVGITTSNNTPALLAGVTLTALHLVASWWNTRRALNLPPSAPKTVTMLPIRAVVFAAVLMGVSFGLTACTGSETTEPPLGTAAATSEANLELSLPMVRTGAAVATGAVLNFGVKQGSTRTRLANEMYSAANAIYSLSGGTFPSPAQFQATILSFGGSQADASYAQFSTAVSGLYASYYPKLVTGDTKAATDLLNAIAGGIEDATASYVTTATPPETGAPEVATADGRGLPSLPKAFEVRWS